MHTHSLFWHTIHYLPLIFIAASVIISVVLKKFTNLKKHLSVFASMGVSAHLFDSGFEFHNSAEPCFLYVSVLVYIAATSFKTLFVTNK